MSDDGRSVRVLQRVIFPTGENLDVVPLYVETNMERGAEISDEVARSKTDPVAPTRVNSVIGETQSSITFGPGPASGPDTAPPAARRSAVVREGRRVSFATYFNAFPASYWRRWTSIDSVTLRFRVLGEATIVIYRSTAKGHSHPVEEVNVAAGEPRSVERTLPLGQFIDGGWYWFDVIAGPGGATLLEADWVTTTPRGDRSSRISIGITTYNRPDFLVDQLRVLGEAEDVLDQLDAVYVVDHGTDRVAEHPDFADAAKALGERLHVIVQPNLGGSGGFSRAMDETVRAGRSDYVLLLDDDVTIEPEGILRAVAFGDLAKQPTIVGGHMFSLYDRSVLHAYGETVAPWKWWWGSAPNTKSKHDFGRRSLRHTPWLHRRVDADYNGWWMCLIPTRVVDELGLALPVFIKWDDAEYGLRAAKAGYPTVSMPGVAAWHVPWDDKNDALDWQAYYHVRNRLITALLHSPYDRGGRVVAEIGETQIQHLLSLQYSTAELRLLAIEDLLRGPGHLHPDLPVKTAELREVRRHFRDAQSAAEVEAFPPVRRRKPVKRGKQFSSPTNPVGLIVKAGRGAVRQLTTPAPLALRHPSAVLPYQDAIWWRLANMDSALVSSPDGASTAWHVRDPQQFRALLRRSVVLHARLLQEWPRLRDQYRSAARDFTSPEQWRQTFDGTREP